MPNMDLRGQLLSIRIRNPKLFKSFYYPKLRKTVKFLTADVGEPGRLQIVRGKLKSTGEWADQSYRLNLNDYYNSQDAINELNDISILSEEQIFEAIQIIRKWFKS